MTLKIHELPADEGKQQKTKRIGRGQGSGHGKTAGKGHKGQQARSGSGKGRMFEGGQTSLMRRLPKCGFSNARFRTPRAEVRVGSLERFDAGATVDPEAMHQAGLVQLHVERIKIINTGELKKALTVKAHGFTKGAREAIEAAGGSCEVIGK